MRSTPPEANDPLGPRHPAVRRLRELLRDRTARASEWAFVVEGPRAVDAALDRAAALEAVYLGPNAEYAFAPLVARVREAAVPVEHLKDGVLERVGSTVTPQPVLAVASIPGTSAPSEMAPDGLVLVAVGVADPGNLGTLLRSAEASGVRGMVIGAGSVDAYNPKVVRASAGAIFGVPLVHARDEEGWTVMDTLDELRTAGRTLYGTRAGAGRPPDEVDLAAPSAVLVGNEARGLDDDVAARVDGWISIPMAGAAESLNVAMAGTVVCFEAARQRALARVAPGDRGLAVTLAELEALLTDADPDVVALAGVASLDALAGSERALVGRGSPMSRAKEAIKGLEPADKPAAGKAVNAFGARVADATAKARAELEALAAASAPVDALDLTLGGHARPRGHLHLVTQVQRELEDIFTGMGYLVMEGPEVEDDWHNFEALNMVPGHPARSMQDTLYVELGEPEQVLLRTHTSPIQIRTMETMAPPIYIVGPGRAYRNETLDARHSPVFHQIEALAVDRGITMADLFGTIETFVRVMFDDDRVRTRFRPDFFPYTEPSAELAVSCIFCDGAGCRVCSHTGWIELGGCGMVDPDVLQGVGIDPEEYTGFAFGFGIDRIAMIRYSIDEIKTLFENDVRFLAQF